MIETSEYTIPKNPQYEPAFNWWVPHVIKKRERIITLVKNWSASYLKKRTSLALESPRVWTKNYNIDAQTGNVLWTNAISKEITGVKVAFKSLEDSEDVPIG